LKQWEFYQKVVRREIMRKSFNFKLSSLPADAKKEMKDILQD